MLHRALYRRWVTGLWSGRYRAEDVVSGDFVGHWPTRDVHGPAELQAVIDDVRRTFRELQFVIDVGPLHDGDLVAGRWIGTGATRDGPARYTGNDIIRIANGTIVEYWNGAARA